MAKRKLSLLFVLLLALLMPAFALAGETGDFTVTGGTLGKDYQYYSENNLLVILSDTPLTISGGTADQPTSDRLEVYSEVKEAHITLNGVHIRSDVEHAILTPADALATITLADGSRNTLTANGECTSGIYGCGSVTINGNGTLTTAGTDCGIIVDGEELIINGGTITAKCTTEDAFGIYLERGNLTINGGNITAIGAVSGINAGDGQKMNINGGKVTATGNDFCGIEIWSGELSIKNATVNAEGGQHGIQARTGAISGNSKVDATGNGEIGILFSEGEASIADSNVTANGSNVGIVVETGDLSVKNSTIDSEGGIFGIEVGAGHCTIDGGSVKANGSESGIALDGSIFVGEEGEWDDPDKYIAVDSDLKISNATVKAMGDYSGIRVSNGDITVNGGHVTANGMGESADEEDFHTGIEVGNGHITVSDDAIVTTSSSMFGLHINRSDDGNKNALLVKGGELNSTGGYYGIVLDNGDLTMENGKVTATGTNEFGVIVRGDATIKGGKLTATGGNVGIEFGEGRDLLISGGEVNATCNGYAAISLGEGSVSISGGKVKADGGEVGISVGFIDNETPVGGNFSVTGGKVTATGKGVGVTVAKGNVTINCDTLTAEGGIVGMEVNNGDVTVNGGTVTITSNDETALVAYNGSLTVSDGKLTVTSQNNEAIGFDKNITVNGGTVTATGSSSGITTWNGDLTVRGGTVTATGNNDCGITASEGNVTIDGGTVKATGKYIGIVSGNGNVTINNGKVTSMGTLESGITSYNGSVAFNGGTVTAAGNAGEASGVLVGNSIIIAGDNVTIQGKGQAVLTPNAPTITGSGLTLLASENFDGSSPVNYVEEDFGAYRYLSLVKKCTVTFDVQGYGAAPADQTVAWDSTIQQPADPVCADYLFGGWYKDAACTTPWNFATDVVQGNMTLFAKWVSDYAITSGADQVVTKGSPATFRSNAPFDKFDSVKVDGHTIASSNYTKKEGSTIITLNAEYVNTLSVGNHKLTIVSSDGEASAHFTVVAQPAATQPPKTGDDSHPMLYLALLLMSLIGITAMRKRVRL